MYKITLSLLLFLAFTGIDQSTIFAQSDNPIMVIRCRFDAEEFLTDKSPINQSKTIEESSCPPGYIPTDDGGCVPNCNYFASGFVYNPETGMCDCDDSASSSKGENSKVDETPSCAAFCFNGLFRKGILEEISTEEVACNPCEYDQLYLNGICYEPKDCFDGLVDITPTIDCNNVISGKVMVALVITGLTEVLEEGDFVSLVDIENCFSQDDTDDALFLENLVLSNEIINSTDGPSENAGLSFGPANAAGEIEITFWADQDQNVSLEFGNQNFEIETCASDPCSCENPDNIRENGEVVLFADVLTITDLPPGAAVELNSNNNELGFTDASGTPYSGISLGNADADGVLEFDFYRASNEPANITYQFPTPPDNDPVVRTFISGMTCDATTCAIIPTMGQWGLLILALILSSIGLVFIGRRRLA